MQSETGFPSSHQLKSYVASKSRLKLAARAVLSADAGLLVLPGMAAWTNIWIGLPVLFFWFYFFPHLFFTAFFSILYTFTILFSYCIFISLWMLLVCSKPAMNWNVPGGKEGTVIAVLHRLYHEMSAGPCTEEVARTLLKVMSENCQELEAHHRGQLIVMLQQLHVSWYVLSALVFDWPVYACWQWVRPGPAKDLTQSLVVAGEGFLQAGWPHWCLTNSVRALVTLLCLFIPPSSILTADFHMNVCQPVPHPFLPPLVLENLCR